MICKKQYNCKFMKSDQSSDRCTWSENKSFSIFCAGCSQLLLGMLTNGVGLDKFLELLLAHLRHSRIRARCQTLDNLILTRFLRVWLSVFIWLHVLVNLGSCNANRDEWHNPSHVATVSIWRQINLVCSTT